MTQNVVFNGSEVALEVDIEFGAVKTSVFIQPKGRATIAENFQVTPLFLLLNPSVRQTSKADFEVQKALLTSRASYFQPAAVVATALTPNKTEAEVTTQRQAAQNK